MVSRKTLIYALIVFILSFGITYVVIRNLKKDKEQEAIEKVEVK
jgi:uncharacterized membrane protein